MSATFEIKRAKSGEYVFNLKAANGENVLVSERYTRKSATKKGIESVKKNASIDRRYDKRLTAKGRPYFVLKARNGEIIGTSKPYSTRSAMQIGIDSVKESAADADVADESVPSTTSEVIEMSEQSAGSGAIPKVIDVLDAAGNSPALDALLKVLELHAANQSASIVAVFKNQNDDWTFNVKAVEQWSGSIPSHLNFLDPNLQPVDHPTMLTIEPRHSVSFVIENGSGGGIALVGRLANDDTKVAVLYLLAAYSNTDPIYPSKGVWIAMELMTPEELTKIDLSSELNDLINNDQLKNSQNTVHKSRLFGLQLPHYNPTEVGDWTLLADMTTITNAGGDVEDKLANDEAKVVFSVFKTSELP